MAANTNPIFIKSFNNKGTTIQNAQGTELQTIFTAGAEGSRIVGISCLVDNTSDRTMDLYPLLVTVYLVRLYSGF